MIVIAEERKFDIPESACKELFKYIGHYEVKPEPTWDRMEVLRGEWIPKMRQAYYVVNVPEWSGRSFERVDNRHGNTPYTDGTCQFFPTRELAEEYLLIGEGEWYPGVRDECWCVLKTDIQLTAKVTHHLGSYLPEWAYFPSEAQRSAYIAKHKPVERPLVGKEAIIDGTKYILQ